MRPFSTEFPVQPSKSPQAFIEEVIAWLQGIKNSTVVSIDSAAELDGEVAYLLSETGEELRFRELQENQNYDALGFRHEFPDDEGRLWRSEAVLRKGLLDDGQDLIRFRTQCLAQRPGVELESPRKPYLIKSLLQSGWGGLDKTLGVSDQPTWLRKTDEDLSQACSVTLGSATRWLPVVYVSALEQNKWLLSSDQIKKLAFDLGGVAHVVVEPDRAFSFNLKDETDARNAYGGTIGICLPEKGLVRRFYFGWHTQDSRELAISVRFAALNLRQQMPATGWDWTDLQEEALYRQRHHLSDKISAEESASLYQEEIQNLQDRVHELEGQLNNQSSSDDLRADDGEFLPKNLIQRIGPEIYAGEISDRLRYAVFETLAASERIGLDARSKTVLERFVSRTITSPALNEFVEDLNRATRDGKRLSKEVPRLLVRHGYQEKSEKKHVTLESQENFQGLETLTVPKTPSDHRASKNLRAQVKKTLGINRLLD